MVLDDTLNVLGACDLTVDDEGCDMHSDSATGEPDDLGHLTLIAVVAVVSVKRKP